MLKVLCFGNPHFKKDKLALEVGRKLKKQKIPGIEFIECGIADEILFDDELERNSVVILDVVKGIDGVRFVEPNELKTARTVTAHDIDIGFYLRLLEKTGKRIEIIGIPEGMETENAAKGVKKLISIFSSKRR